MTGSRPAFRGRTSNAKCSPAYVTISRAPLSSIVMGADLLGRVLPQQDEVALRVIDTIRRATHQMTGLLTSFGDLGALQSGGMQLERKRLDPEEVVLDVYEAAVPEVTQRRVRWNVDCHPSLAGECIHGDRERLTQALRMLTSCALRLVPQGGALAITLAPDGASGARFAVAASRGTDAGPFACDLARPELALARGLVELHGSRLEVHHDAHRAELAFALPRERSATAQPGPAIVAGDAGGLG